MGYRVEPVFCFAQLGMYQLIACTSLDKRRLSRSKKAFFFIKYLLLVVNPQIYLHPIFFFAPNEKFTPEKIAQGGYWNSSIQQMTPCEERWKVVAEAVAFLEDVAFFDCS